jgi:hypothetical protein
MHIFQARQIELEGWAGALFKWEVFYPSRCVYPRVPFGRWACPEKKGVSLCVDREDRCDYDTSPPMRRRHRPLAQVHHRRAQALAQSHRRLPHRSRRVRGSARGRFQWRRPVLAFGPDGTARAVARAGSAGGSGPPAASVAAGRPYGALPPWLSKHNTRWPADRACSVTNALARFEVLGVSDARTVSYAMAFSGHVRLDV